MYEKFFKKVDEANTIAIFMHINPDGDCIGSALALYGYLTNLDKTAHVFLEPNNTIRDCFSFLPYIDKINSTRLKHYDLAVAVDCGDENMLGKMNSSFFFKANDKFLIDHHELGTPFTEENIIEYKAASNTMILFKMFSEFDVKLIDKNIATLLFAGLITDSGALTYSSVTAECFAIAAKLCSYGIDNFLITTKLFKDIKLKAFQLTNRVLSKSEFFFDNRVGIISILEEDFKATNTSNEDTSGIINKLFDVVDVKLAISITELQNETYRIGFRSKDKVNAGKCAKYFGGGGHFSASGCRISGSFDEVKEKLLNMIAETECLTAF